ncbi:MAG: acyl--CoA ligase [Acidobacteriia bacterium]|nr:acyl--CoA ligase [Terriglobia bacterium]
MFESLSPNRSSLDMAKSEEWNFAGRLIQRLGPGSCLIDASSGETLRGRAITDTIIAFAAGFLSTGMHAGDRVLIGCGLSPGSALAYLGAMYAGLVPVPVEQRVLPIYGEALLDKTGAKAAWTARDIGLDCTGDRNVVRAQGYFTGSGACSLKPFPSSETDIAALMPTSGSTGIPRLVMVSHGNLLANTEAIVRSQKLGTDERAMLVMPISYVFGASILHSHMYQGGAVVFDSRFTFPDKVLRAINAHACTTFAGVPTAYSMLLRRSNLRSIPLPTLRRFLQAGGALSTQSIQETRQIVPSAAFFVMYGQTEATARISCLPPERLQEKLGSAGVPLDNLTVHIKDDEGRELPAGQTGEVWVRGPSVCCGYLDDPEETKRKFVDGWLRTDDLGSLDKDGYLWIKGRKGEFVKMRGLRVSFAEVEAKVAAVSGVCECAATAVPHREAGEALAVFIVPEAGDSGVCERVRRSLPFHWTCENVRVLAEIPKTSNGKIARSQLMSFL